MTWKNRESIFVFRNVVNLYIFKGTYNAQTMLSICIDRSKIRLGGGYWTRRERRAVASFVYGSCPFSQASGRLRAPLYDPATAQRRRRDPIRCAPPTPRPVLILIFPAHSLCKLPDVEFPLPSLLRSIDRMLLRSFLLWDGLAWMLHSPSLRVF